MGLFSRKQKSPRESGILESQSTTSFGSSTFRGMNNRASAGSMLTPNTPLSPMPSIKIPKIDLPRPPDPQLDPAGYLRSLTAVRERAKVVLDKAQQNDLVHFDVDMNKFPDVVTFVSGLIKVCLLKVGGQKECKLWDGYGGKAKLLHGGIEPKDLLHGLGLNRLCIRPEKSWAVRCSLPFTICLRKCLSPPFSMPIASRICVSGA